MVMEQVILRYLRQRASAFEQRQLKRWREASPENEAKFQEYALLWKLAEVSRPSGSASPPPVDQIRRQASAAARDRAKPLTARRNDSMRWGRRGLVAAAILTLAVGLSQLRHHEQIPPFNRLIVSEFVTGPGEKVTMQTDDGTVVHLGPSTRLRLGDAGREVWLDGRAFFGVSRDEQHPFIVNTTLGQVEVLGTRFDLSTQDSRIQLVVVDGRVALAGADGRRAELSGGEQGTMVEGRAPDVREVEDLNAALEWLDNTFIFQATPLHQVLAELKSRYDVEVGAIDDSLRSRTVTGWFDGQTVDEIFTALCRALGAQCIIRDREIVILP